MPCDASRPAARRHACACPGGGARAVRVCSQDGRPGSALHALAERAGRHRRGTPQSPARRSAGYQREVALSARCGELIVAGPRRRLRPRHPTPGGNQDPPWRCAIASPRTTAPCTGRKRACTAGCCASSSAWIASKSALVYFNIDTAQETVLPVWHSALELKTFFESLCERYADWARAERQHRAARDAALQRAGVSVRGHSGLASASWRPLCTAAHGAARHLLAQAPTGIGKTMATLFAALRAAPAQGTRKLFYLTAKTPGRQLALHALQRMQVKPLRVLELVAREKACEHPDKACHGESCPLARGFYDRLPQRARTLRTRAGSTSPRCARSRCKPRGLPLLPGPGPAALERRGRGRLQPLLRPERAAPGTLTCERRPARGPAGRRGAQPDRARAPDVQRRAAPHAAFQAVRKTAPAALKKSMDRLQRQWGALARLADAGPRRCCPSCPARSSTPCNATAPNSRTTSRTSRGMRTWRPAGLAVRGAALPARGRGVRPSTRMVDLTRAPATPKPRAPPGAEHPQPRSRPAAASRGGRPRTAPRCSRPRCSPMDYVSELLGLPRGHRAAGRALAL
jgi:hypothetical protein